MLYLTFWFLQGFALLLLKISLLIYSLFLIGALFTFLKTSKFFFLFYLLFSVNTIILITLPPLIYLALSLPLFFILYIVEPSPSNSPKIKILKLFSKNLELAIKIREILHIPDHLYFKLSYLKLPFSLSFSLFFGVIFLSYHHVFILVTSFTLIITAWLLGSSFSFFSQFIYFLFQSPSNTPYSHFSTNQSPLLMYAEFLSNKIKTHPLEAIVEEIFFEDNLQIGDFYLVYPIFFKATPLQPGLLTPEQEAFNIWHLIRWESALSKQTGSAASRWSSLFDIKSTPIQRRVHSIHTPLIPVYREELYSHLLHLNLPTFDPFNQPPNWRPYLILIQSLNWDDNEVKEERLKEIEEEDWQCSLHRTSSLHLDRGNNSPEPSTRIWW